MKQPISLKKLAMRVNTPSLLGEFPTKPAPQREATAQPSNANNPLWARPVMVPARWESARPEADAHLTIKSRGV